MPFSIVNGDITKMETDAVVNAANEKLKKGSGVCGAIFKAAGSLPLGAECRKIGHCDIGRAVITNGYKLKAKYIIHTPGPKWKGGEKGEEPLLYSCYTSSLQLAAEHQLHSVAFPLISAGVRKFPKERAKEIAEQAITDFLKTHDDGMDVYLVLL